MSRLRMLALGLGLVIVGWTMLAAAGAEQVSAGGTLCFVDAAHGWRTTYTGSGSNPSTAKAIAWRTTDAAVSWKRLSTRACAFTGAMFGGGFVAFATRTTGIWVREGHSTLLRTTNAGTTWKAVRPGAGGWLTDASFATSRVGWGCTQLGTAPDSKCSIIRTTDAGRTWRVQKRLIGYVDQVSCPSARRCYVLASDIKGQAVWATGDGGRHWVRRRLPSGTWWRSIDFPAATTGWAVSDEGTVAKTTNGGKTWSRKNLGSELYDVSFCSSQVGSISSGGFVWHTANAGKTWVAQGVLAESAEPLSEVLCLDSTHVWVLVEDGNALASSDGGTTWRWCPWPGAR